MNLQEIKQRVYLMRNGAVVEQMRSAGIIYKYNFGVILPQLKEIAADAVASMSAEEARDVACRLRADILSRESQLLAPLIMPLEAVDAEEAAEWLLSVPTEEVTDVVCHGLLRRHPQAAAIAADVYGRSQSSLQRYAALRLALNLLMLRRGEAEIEALCRSLAEAETARPEPLPLGARLTEDV